MSVRTQLDYAPGAPIRRRRRIRRIVMLVVLLALVYPAYRFGPRTIRQASLLYEQHRCMVYSAPADRVVYDQASETSSAREKEAGYQGILS